MRKLKNTILSIVTGLFILGCSPTLDKEITTIDIHGYKYRFIGAEKVVTNNIKEVEIWERISPLDTNHWYTPTYSSKLNTNSPMVFQSLGR